jgi:hypothetical protein
VWETESSTAVAWWHYGVKLIIVDARFLCDPETTPANIAATLVHEATHARLDRIGYAPEKRARVEGLCFRRERAFARRLPDSHELVAEIDRQLSATLLIGPMMRMFGGWLTSWPSVAFRDGSSEPSNIVWSGCGITLTGLRIGLSERLNAPQPNTNPVPTGDSLVHQPSLACHSYRPLQRRNLPQPARQWVPTDENLGRRRWAVYSPQGDHTGVILQLTQPKFAPVGHTPTLHQLTSVGMRSFAGLHISELTHLAISAETLQAWC